jgi:hypothetical protein
MPANDFVRYGHPNSDSLTHHLQTRNANTWTTFVPRLTGWSPLLAARGGSAAACNHDEQLAIAPASAALDSFGNPSAKVPWYSLNRTGVPYGFVGPEQRQRHSPLRVVCGGAVGGTESRWRENGSASGEVVGPDTCRRGGGMGRLNGLRSLRLVSGMHGGGHCTGKTAARCCRGASLWVPQSSGTCEHPTNENDKRGPSVSVGTWSKMGRAWVNQKVGRSAWMGEWADWSWASPVFYFNLFLLLFSILLYFQIQFEFKLCGSPFTNYICEIRSTNFGDIYLYIYYLYFHNLYFFLLPPFSYFQTLISPILFSALILNLNLDLP